MIYLKSKDYIAIEKNKLNTYYFENQEINHCINPFYHYDIDHCEIQAISNKSTNNCKQYLEDLNSFWINVDDTKKLYINIHQKEVKVNNESLQLCHSGLLYAKNKTSVTTNEFTFFMNIKNYWIESNSTQADFLYIQNYMENSYNETLIKRPVKSKISYAYKFNEITEQIKNIKLALPNNLREYIYDYQLQILSIIILVCITIYIYYKLKNIFKINYALTHEKYFK